jgi:hypothetical protein
VVVAHLVGGHRAAVRDAGMNRNLIGMRVDNPQMQVAARVGGESSDGVENPAASAV